MRFITASFAAFLSLSVLAGEPADCGIRETSYPPAYATASMLNGEFWMAASPDVRMFYVRAATESLAASGVKSRRTTTVGWTYPRLVEWISSFYSSEKRFRRIPVAIAFSYAMRARDGEARETLQQDATMWLRRIVPNEGDR